MLNATHLTVHQRRDQALEVTLAVTTRAAIHSLADTNQIAKECAKRAWLATYGDIAEELGKLSHTLTFIALDHASLDNDSRFAEVRKAIQDIRVRCSNVQPWGAP
jgi:hypothetical protein